MVVGSQKKYKVHTSRGTSRTRESGARVHKKGTRHVSRR